MAGEGQASVTVSAGAVFEPIRHDLAGVEVAIRRALDGPDPHIVELATYLQRGGGKRLRPALLLLTARNFHYDRDRLLPVAAAVELIHMATLVHDDIVDGATARRGLPTVNVRWGTGTAVLTGDFLFARAFSLLAADGDNRVVRVMAEAVYEMSTGEIEQQAQLFDPSTGEEGYYRRIFKKTAHFISHCCLMGGLMGGASDRQVEALRRYGYGIGMGFQVIDDILDLTGDPEELGKPRGTDLRSGVLTLPVLFALAKDPQPWLLERLEARQVDDATVERVTAWVEAAGGLDYARRRAEQFVHEALEALDELAGAPMEPQLRALARFILDRKH
ncbi:polyprenyl synthetase family protein [Thermaerobacter litoralis]